MTWAGVLWVVGVFECLIAIVLFSTTTTRTWRLPDKISAFGLLFNVLTFAGAVVGVLIAYSAFTETRRQADEAKRQADSSEEQTVLAKDTAKRQLRAYVFATPNPLKHFAVNEAPEGSISVQMIGQTPAYDLKFATTIATLPYPLRGDIRQNKPNEAIQLTRSILFPGQNLTNTVQLGYAPNAEQMTLLKQANSALYLWGTVTYKDSFEEEHRVLYCFHYDAAAISDPGSVPICDQHVEAD
jgi:hypothetical protein